MLLQVLLVSVSLATAVTSHPLHTITTAEPNTDAIISQDDDTDAGFFESDIVLSPEQLELVEEAKNPDVNISDVINNSTDDRISRKAVSATLLWPGGRIPYRFDATITDSVRSTILQAIAHWEEHTCLQFDEVTTGRSFISFFKGKGCWSNIGRNTVNANFLSIGPSCNTLGTVIHEIGHAIGFWHEHTRPDRDNYINVHYENIKPGREMHFDIYDIGQGHTYGVPYDIESIMHYGEYSFTYNLRKTITTKDPSKQSLLGQEEGLSFYDIMLANQMYECNANCPSLDCQNGGYVGKNCQCVCPQDTSGPLCQSSTNVPDSGIDECRDQLFGTSGTFSSPNYPLRYPTNQNCVWRIQVPVGKVISLTFDDFRVEANDAALDCRGGDYVEIRNENLVTEGNRYCGYDIPSCFTSTSNVVFIYFRSDDFRAQYISRFQISYEAIDRGQTCYGPTEAPTTLSPPTTVQPETCQQTLSEDLGSFTTPGYPNRYENDQECEWTIYAPSDHVIELEFVDFHLQRSGLSCDHDYIEVSLGYEWSTPARSCGSGPRTAITSTSNRMIVTFRSDANHSYKGFKANYRFIAV